MRSEMGTRFGAVEARFDSVESRFNSFDSRLDTLDARMTSRIDDVQRAIIYLAVSLTAAIVAGFAGMTALIATQV